MQEFIYKAKDPKGIAHAGAITASTHGQAAAQLRNRGWVILKLTGQPQGNANPSAASWSGWESLPPRAIHVEVSLQQLALMLRSGMTLLAALQSVAEQTTSPSLKQTWTRVSQQIQAGQGFSEALSRHRCFPEFVIRLMEVGEHTGNLEIVLGRAATTMRSRRSGREAFASATIYPVLILLLSLAVTTYMVIYLIPRLQLYLQSLGRELPGMTQALIDGSGWLRANFLMLVAAIVIVIAAAATTWLSREGRAWCDRHSLKIPLLGPLIQMGETSVLARSLSVLLKSGITLTEGLQAVEKILSNRFLRGQLALARERIIRGSNLVDALNPDAFAPMLPRMAAVGQHTGEMDVVLEEVADLYDAQLKSRIKRLNAILTPLMTIAIGGVVGYVYVAFFMALVAAGS